MALGKTVGKAIKADTNKKFAFVVVVLVVEVHPFFVRKFLSLRWLRQRAEMRDKGMLLVMVKHVRVPYTRMNAGDFVPWMIAQSRKPRKSSNPNPQSRATRSSGDGLYEGSKFPELTTEGDGAGRGRDCMGQWG